MKILLIIITFTISSTIFGANNRSILKARKLFNEAKSDLAIKDFNLSKTLECKQYGMVYKKPSKKGSFIAEYLSDNNPPLIVLRRPEEAFPMGRIFLALTDNGIWADEDYRSLTFKTVRIHNNGSLVIEVSSDSRLTRAYRQINCIDSKDCFNEDSLVFNKVPVTSYEVCKQ